MVVGKGILAPLVTTDNLTVFSPESHRWKPVTSRDVLAVILRLVSDVCLLGNLPLHA